MALNMCFEKAKLRRANLCPEQVFLQEFIGKAVKKKTKQKKTVFSTQTAVWSLGVHNKGVPGLEWLG